MITDYFTSQQMPIITDYYELHRSFIDRHNFKNVFAEIALKLTTNSSRQSCVCIDDDLADNFNLYDLPTFYWTENIKKIKTKIIEKYHTVINYGLVHYYADDKSNIAWHSDKEALKSNIYSISIGGIRRFSLRDKLTKKVFDFNLYDGDLFIMKIGCQDKYEHCIKSVKQFNIPRISITFRQIEKPLCYFIYDPFNISAYILDNQPIDSNYVTITETKEKIVLGIIINDEKHFDLLVESNFNMSLVKSNLQKSIRRQQHEVALQSTMEMIISGNHIDLLRRLTIITIEDVSINKYYSIIVWLYVASSNGYKLTKHDVNIIYSYVIHLCNINSVHEIKNDNIIHNNILQQFYTNIYCVSLYLRLQFGGFNGEKILLNNFIYGIVKKEIDINDENMILFDYKIYQKLTILECSIDFHCFPKMIEKILSKISVGLNEKELCNYIWTFDSNINSRKIHIHNLDEDLWNKIIKPQCDNYRYFIMKMIYQQT